MDRNKLITKLQNLTKSGRRPKTSPGLVNQQPLLKGHYGEAWAVSCFTMGMQQWTLNFEPSFDIFMVAGQTFLVVNGQILNK